MIVGKNGQIINNNAPRPSDPRLQTVLDILLQQQLISIYLAESFS